jgi:surfactin synthase thioesterase subunit
VLKKPLGVPVAAIGGQQSSVFTKSQAARMKNKLKINFEWLPGTHMFPLEYPDATAATIKKLSKEMTA